MRTWRLAWFDAKAIRIRCVMYCHRSYMMVDIEGTGEAKLHDLKAGNALLDIEKWTASRSSLLSRCRYHMPSWIELRRQAVCDAERPTVLTRSILDPVISTTPATWW